MYSDCLMCFVCICFFVVIVGVWLRLSFFFLQTMSSLLLVQSDCIWSDAAGVGACWTVCLADD